MDYRLSVRPALHGGRPNDTRLLQSRGPAATATRYYSGGIPGVDNDDAALTTPINSSYGNRYK
jgi:hypothetical protein